MSRRRRPTPPARPDDVSITPVRLHAAPQPLPVSLTFFLAPHQRRRVLERLAAIHADRARALLVALGVDEDGQRAP